MYVTAKVPHISPEAQYGLDVLVRVLTLFIIDLDGLWEGLGRPHGRGELLQFQIPPLVSDALFLAGLGPQESGWPCPV